MKTCFKLKEVRKTYGASVGKKVVRPALNVAELEFYEGQTTAIIGYSGSGKSSLLNLLSLLDVPDQGQGDIFYQGQSYRDISTNEGAKNRLRRDAFGFVFQDNHLLDHLNSLRNVGLGLALKGLPLNHCDSVALELLDAVGIATKARSLPSELSGGEKQRVAVMRAIAHDPSVVFADEPTGNLDWDTGLVVMERLAKWREDSGRTLIIVSHNIHQIIDFADRFIMLKDGEVIFRGIRDAEGASPIDGEELVDGPDCLTEVLRRHSSVHKSGGPVLK